MPSVLGERKDPFSDAWVRKNYFIKRILGAHRIPQSGPAKMQSTINFALRNACNKLNLPSTFAAAIILQLWQTKPPAPAPAPVVINLEKLNRQQVQKLEELANEAGDSTDDKALHKMFLSRINGLPAAAFKSKSLIEHMRDFLGLSDHVASNAAAPAVPEEDDEEDLAEVVWHLRTYDVGVKTHRVYEMRNGVHVFVGMLGMNEFRGMEMPELE